MEIAKRHGGEIVNADAMQLYEGLPVVTNKITTSEQQGIPHHLLGCIGLKEETWTVGKFVKEALTVIEEIRSRGRLPIVVGGTHYYTQALLFEDKIVEGNKAEEELQDGADEDGSASIEQVLSRPTEELLRQLEEVDPVMAGRWHPKDRRKIQRSLEIYLRTARKASELYAEQQIFKGAVVTADGASASQGGGLRFPTVIFWLHAKQDALRSRLDGRIEKMLDAGLLDEVRRLDAFASAEAAAGTSVDETRGIWVSIGYKEFKEYIAALNSTSQRPQQLAKLRADAVERTRAATRQYAKRQLRWIRIKLLNGLIGANGADNLYVLDASDSADFDATAVAPALDITQRFLIAAPLPDPTTVWELGAELLKPKREYDLETRPETWTKQHCSTCNVTCVVAEQWEQHVKSKSHRKAVSKGRQREAHGAAHGAAAHAEGNEGSDGS